MGVAIFTNRLPSQVRAAADSSPAIDRGGRC
jgi:hypothetical protein